MPFGDRHLRLPNTLQPILKPLNKIGTFIFRKFSRFRDVSANSQDFSETPYRELSLSLLNHDAKYLPCMNYNFIESRFSFKRMFGK